MVSVPDDHTQADAGREIWTAIDRADLIVEQFEDEFILYNVLSGETHVLNRESRLIIDAISGRPAGTDVIRSALMSMAPDLPEMDRGRIERHLTVLEQWGIVTRVQ